MIIHDISTSQGRNRTRVSGIVQGVQWHSMAQGSTFWVKTITKLAVCYYKKPFRSKCCLVTPSLSRFFRLWLAYLLEVTWRNPCEIAVFDDVLWVLTMGTPQIGDVWTWLQVRCSSPPSLLSVRFTPSANQKFEYQIKKKVWIPN